MIEQNNTESRDRRELLLILLQNFSNLRSGQDQVLWSIIGAFWTTNSLLLVSIFTTDRQDRVWVGLIISFVGIIISYIWNRIQSRSLSRVEIYEKSIIKIEKELNLDFDICSHLQANTDDYLKTVNKKSARYAMRWFSKYAIYAWILAILIFAGLFINTSFLSC